MSHLLNQSVKVISRVAIFAVSILSAPFGLNAYASTNQQPLSAAKTELLSKVHVRLSYSYRQALACYDQSFSLSNSGKINLLAISRIGDVAFNTKFINAASHFLDIRATQLLQYRRLSHFSSDQEVFARSREDLPHGLCATFPYYLLTD